MPFWHKQQKGANIFNERITRDIIHQAKVYGIDFIRLAPDKFPSKEQDFLLGNADRFTHIVPEDMTTLKALLDTFALKQIPVILTFLSLPGSRWKQNNGNKDDLRLWIDTNYINQSAQFWQEVATALKGHPALIGYNILNEPHPERLPERIRPTDSQLAIQMHDFHARVIQEIRKVDSMIPIIIDAGSYADPRRFEFLLPQTDSNVIYSLHMYEPYKYTNKKENDGKYSYPGEIPYYGKNYAWNRTTLERYMQPVIEFQKKYQIPGNRILVGEFGGNRVSAGLENYFSDLIAIFNAHDWHWAVYSFREDTWDGMDYELGSAKLPWSYWQAIDSGKVPIRPYKSDNPIFNVLKQEWK
jgi:hypothetical protein